MNMDKKTIMNPSIMKTMLASLSRDGVEFYSGTSRLHAGEIYRKPLKGAFYPPQQHSCVELIWRIEGELLIHINGDWTAYRDRRTKVFGPGTWHSEHFLPGQTYKLLWLTIMPNTIVFHCTYFTEHGRYSDSRRRLPLSPPMAPKLCRSSLSPGLSHDAVAQAEFHYLLMETLHFCLRNKEIFPSNSDHFQQQIVEYLQNYLENYYWHDIDLGQMAEAVHYSPGHLNALFRDATGEPLVRYLNRLRLEKAHALLTRGEMIVKQAAEAVGIHDPLYFSRKFRQHFGVSPQSLIKKKDTK